MKGKGLKQRYLEKLLNINNTDLHDLTDTEWMKDPEALPPLLWIRIMILKVKILGSFLGSVFLHIAFFISKVCIECGLLISLSLCIMCFLYMRGKHFAFTFWDYMLIRTWYTIVFYFITLSHIKHYSCSAFQTVSVQVLLIHKPTASHSRKGNINY